MLWPSPSHRFHVLLIAVFLGAFLCGCTGLVSNGYGGGGNGGGQHGPIPAVPGGLAATAGNGLVSLSWTASSGAIGYYVKRSTVSGGLYTQIAALGGTTYADNGVTNGTKYFYVVSAYNSAGQSANSSEVSATPQGPQPPSAPTNLAATAGDRQVALIWTASSGATSYHVKRSTTSGGGYVQIATAITSSFTDSTVANGTKYFYVVTALNANGESGTSNEAGATPTAPATPPGTPTGLQATAGNAQVSLTWTGSTGATGYNVKRSTTNATGYLTVGSPTSASFTNIGLTNGTTYYFVVTAVNAAGESSPSLQVSATPVAPAQPPPAPTGLIATAGNAQVSLTWTASTGATSYHVKRSTTNGSGYTQVGAPTATDFVDVGLTNGTTYDYVVTALNAAGESGNSNQASATPQSGTVDVTITVDPTKTKPISPYIYGINFYSGNPGASPLITFDRDGGNRWTAYNWETNASNAGSDYLYENDNYLSSSNVPAEAVRGFIAGDQAANMASLVTVQLQGLVAGDENGPVSVTNPPDLTRFKTVVNQKSTVSNVPFTLTPPTNDANVYMDEFVWALDQKFSGQGIFGTSPTHPTFLSLDNEPELWNSTHLELQGHNPVTSDNYIAKTITLTKAIKDQFPNAVIFGPVHYGFQGIYNWQGELSATPTGTNWFPDKYLQALNTASSSYGKPLVDVYDFHWYAEVYDSSGNRIINLNSTTLTDAQIQLIVQSPRNLWDPTFHDDNNSNPWIYQELGSTPINLLGHLQAKIDSEFPGMKISITEYESGGWNHIAGTIAEADNLGVFGSQGLFAASFWPPNGTYSYALAGFRAFRGFDGAASSFGDTSLEATSSAVQNVVLYASTDSKTPGRVVFVAINRSNSSKVTAINGQALSGTAHLYQMTAATATGQNPVQPVSIGTMPASGSSLTITLPAYSVTTIDVH